MEPFDLKDVRELIEFLKSNDIAEFDLSRGEHRLHLKFSCAFPPPIAPQELMSARMPPVPPASLPGPAPASAPALPLHVPAVHAEESLYEVKSPIVGTFYESSAPGAPAFIKAGDVIEIGQVLCIVEAMKLMNEIESDIAGEVVRVIAKNGQPVEYGQPLYAVRTR